jgi:hypothetical protein
VKTTSHCRIVAIGFFASYLSTVYPIYSCNQSSFSPSSLLSADSSSSSRTHVRQLTPWQCESEIHICSQKDLGVVPPYSLNRTLVACGVL